MPSFSRLRPREKPGRLDSTRNSVTPLARRRWSRSWWPARSTSQSWPLEMNTFWPLMTKSSPSRTRLRAHRLQVAAGMRLGHAERADRLAAHHLRQPMPLLLLGAERQDVGGDEIGVDQKAGPAGADAPKLLEHDDVEQIVEAEAAVFLRHGAAQQALFARLQPEFARHDAVVPPTARGWGTISSSTKRRTVARQMSCSSLNRDAFDHLKSLVRRSGVRRALRLVALASSAGSPRAPRAIARRVSAVEIGEGRGAGEMLAAVDRDRLAGQIVAGVGEQEDDEVLQFLHLARSAPAAPCPPGSPRNWRRGSGSASPTRPRSGNGPGAVALRRMP